MKKEFKTYRNYGVLAAEKRTVYTYGCEHPHSDYADEITVELPENEFFELVENDKGELFVKSAWGWEYDINEVLQGNESPCFFAIDKSGNGHRVYLTEC